MDMENVMILGANTPFDVAVSQWIEEKIRDVFEEETIEGKEGDVYFLQNNQYVKIGCSTQIEERITYLQAEFPGAKFLGCFPSSNMFATERMLHEYFKHKHYRKEWYALDENDIANLDKFAHRSKYDWTELLTDKGKAQLEILESLYNFLLSDQIIDLRTKGMKCYG